MQKIELSDIEKKLIEESGKTSGMLITLLSILQLRHEDENDGGSRSLGDFQSELNDLWCYIEAQQRFEDSAHHERPDIDEQVRDMAYRIKLPEKVALLFERTGFDTAIEFNSAGVSNDQGDDLYRRLRDFSLKAGVDIRLITAETPR